MHHARATLRDSGYRLTPQRTRVWDVLREHGGHLTAEEITREVQTSLPEVNTSTVYRTLDLLVRLGLATQTRLGGATSFYEVAPLPHHHWVCERCGAVGHVSNAAFAGVLADLEARDGFAATRLRATVLGLCKACRDAAPGPGDGDPHT